MLLEERDASTPELRAVLNVVMNQEGVVEELERAGREERLLSPSARCAASREADCRAQSLAFAERVVREQIVERAVTRLPLAFKQAFELGEDIAPRLREGARDQVDVLAICRDGGVGGLDAQRILLIDGGRLNLTSSSRRPRTSSSMSARSRSQASTRSTSRSGTEAPDVRPRVSTPSSQAS